MLTTEDIAEVLHKFEKLENLKKAKASGGGGKEGRRGVSSSYTRDAILVLLLKQ